MRCLLRAQVHARLLLALRPAAVWQKHDVAFYPCLSKRTIRVVKLHGDTFRIVQLGAGKYFSRRCCRDGGVRHKTERKVAACAVELRRVEKAWVRSKLSDDIFGCHINHSHLCADGRDFFSRRLCEEGRHARRECSNPVNRHACCEEFLGALPTFHRVRDLRSPRALFTC